MPSCTQLILAYICFSVFQGCSPFPSSNGPFHCLVLLFPPLHGLVKCVRRVVISGHTAALRHHSSFLCAFVPNTPPCVRWAPVVVGCTFHHAKGNKGHRRTSAPEAVGVPTKAPTQAACAPNCVSAYAVIQTLIDGSF